MDDAETGRRLRAARGYAGLEAEDLAKALNFSVSTLYRTEGGQRPLNDAQKRLVTELCGLPIGFFSVDFAESEMAADGEVTARLAGVEQLVRDLDPEDTRTRLRNTETQLASLVKTREHVSELEDEVRSLHEQVEALTREALERRQHAAVERETGRRATTPETRGARGDRSR